MIRITQAAIKEALPGDVLKDNVVRGLQVRVFEKSVGFYFYYYTRLGEQKRPKIGDVSSLSLPAARRIATQWAAVVAAGRDPSKSRQAARRAPTLAGLWQRYRVEHLEALRRPKTVHEATLVWKAMIEPALGKMKVHVISRDDVQKMHRDNRRRPVWANRAVAHLSSLMSFAEAVMARPQHSNPCRGIEKYREQPRRRYPVGDEPKRLFEALDAIADSDPIFVGYIQLLCLTGARGGELRTAKRDWLVPGGIELEDSKTGPDIIRLGDEAQRVIDDLPILLGNPYLFPGRLQGRPMGYPKKQWKALIEAAGIQNLQMHDLRRFYASALLSEGATLEGVGQMLRHKSPATTKRYAFLEVDAAETAANKAARAIMRRAGR